MNQPKEINLLGYEYKLVAQLLNAYSKFEVKYYDIDIKQTNDGFVLEYGLHEGILSFLKIQNYFEEYEDDRVKFCIKTPYGDTYSFYSRDEQIYAWNQLKYIDFITFDEGHTSKEDSDGEEIPESENKDYQEFKKRYIESIIE